MRMTARARIMNMIHRSSPTYKNLRDSWSPGIKNQKKGQFLQSLVRPFTRIKWKSCGSKKPVNEEQNHVERIPGKKNFHFCNINNTSFHRFLPCFMDQSQMRWAHPFLQKQIENQPCMLLNNISEKQTLELFQL